MELARLWKGKLVFALGGGRRSISVRGSIDCSMLIDERKALFDVHWLFDSLPSCPSPIQA